MKRFSKILNVIASCSLLLAGAGIALVYLLELIVSFFVSTLNMVAIGNVIWRIVYFCLGSAAFAFFLAHIADKKG